MNFWRLAFAGLTALDVSLVAALAKWPGKPIIYFVSFGAGGNADIVARMNAEVLRKALGVPVNVVNKPGGAHMPATMNVKAAPADGYTAFNWSPPSFMIVPLTRQTPYKPLEDLIPLCAGISASDALYVRSDSLYTTFEVFIEGARSTKLKIGVNNLCAPPNLSAVQLASDFEFEFNTIALKTVAATMAGLIGRQVDVAAGHVVSVHAYGDEVRPLVILDSNRKPYFEVELPEVRTVGEAVPGKEAGTWVHGGLAVKAGTPQENVDQLLAATEAMGSAAFMARIPKAVSYDWTHGVDETTALIQSGVDLYTPLLDGLGLLHKR